MNYSLLLVIFYCFYIFQAVHFTISFDLSPSYTGNTIMLFNITKDSIIIFCFFLFFGSISKAMHTRLYTVLPDTTEGLTCKNLTFFIICIIYCSLGRFYNEIIDVLINNFSLFILIITVGFYLYIA